MEAHVSAQLQEYLSAGEKLIWTGQPRRGLVFSKADGFIIPFSTLWCGFSVFWLLLALHRNAPLIFLIFGGVFAGSGLFLLFGRFIIDARVRAHTFYGVTNNRILIKSGISRKSLQSLDIRTITEIQYGEKKDGTGNINIGPKNPMLLWGNNMKWWPGTVVTPSLDLIPDVKRVYNKIIEIQQTA